MGKLYSANIHRINDDFSNMTLESTFDQWQENTADVRIDGFYAGRLYDLGCQKSGLTKVAFTRLHVWSMYKDRGGWEVLANFLQALEFKLHATSGKLVVVDYPFAKRHHEIALDYVSNNEAARFGRLWDDVLAAEYERRRKSDEGRSPDHCFYAGRMAKLSDE